MPFDHLPADTVDRLIASQIPPWIIGAQVDHLWALHRALREQQQVVEQLQQVLRDLPALDSFAELRLEQALEQAGHAGIEVRRARAVIDQQVELPSAAPSLYRPLHTFRSRQPLLAAALHNYREEETSPSILREARLVDGKGKALALGFEDFARLCRRLDLGGRYQLALKARLQPDGESGPGTLAVKALFEAHQRLQLEVEVRQALLKGGLDTRSYLHMLPLLADKPVVPALPEVVEPRQLYLLGKRIIGVVATEVRAAGDDQVQAVILYIPGDPVSPVTRYDSWQALYRGMANRLRQIAYRRFFYRFLGQRDVTAFAATFNRLLAHGSDAQVELDGRHFPITTALAAYLGKQRYDALFEDARVLAVPTDDEDAASRRERLQNATSAALNLLGMVGMFVPVLGELMLVAYAVQLADEVYEGYQDWRLGDREAALEHLFGVAESVVTSALAGRASQGAFALTRRVPFVDGLHPLGDAAGRVRLRDPSLPGYRLENRELSVGQHQQVAGSWRLRTLEGALQIEPDDNLGLWRVLHPRRPGARALHIERYGSGAWRHELERSQEWAGAGYLLRRFGGRLAEIDDNLGAALLQITGLQPEQLRRLHLEGAGTPARLLDALERHDAHQAYPALRHAAFEGYLAERQRAPDRLQALLIRDFPGLSVRGAQQIIEHASGEQTESMQAQGRVPLALAEQARWYLRDSRLDRACAGLQQAQAVNTDTERLVLGLLDHLAPWPADVRVELRLGDAQGELLAAHGPVEGTDVRRIVRSRSGYQVVQGAVATSAPSDSLLQALLLNLGKAQKDQLGEASLSAEALRQHLAQEAVGRRQLVAGWIGMAPIGRGIRAPLRFADGRLGYPLSGRGESSRQALRQGIRQIFPTLTGMQLEAYLADLTNRNVNLWNHYAELRDQLAGLRAALQHWQGEWSNPLDLLRRRRVANAIRRSWRRKQVGLDGDYTLHIDGERVGNLLTLPEDVDFGHVRRLVLRNMGLTNIDEGFLRRFANIVELDLRENSLTQVPAGIEHLSRLRLLNLSRNQIVMDLPGGDRLSALAQLVSLDLAHNPLGNAPDLRALPNLRNLSLRATGLEALPDPVRRLSWRALVDLRQNRIRQLREELFGLSQRVELQRLRLHDNPLEQRALERLDEVSESSGASTRRASFTHGEVNEALLDSLLIDTRPEQRAARQAMWHRLQAEPEAADLFIFIADLANSTDFQTTPQAYRGRIWRILEACDLHETLRVRAFTEAGGSRTCEDRLLLILSQLETALLAEEAVAGGPASQVERRLLRLGRSLHRLDQVDRAAMLHVQQMRQSGAPLIDQIETQLFYRIHLTPSLGLPAQPETMRYPAFAGVSSSDLLRVEMQILQAENPEVLVESLAQRPFWERYARERYAERFEALVAPFHMRLEALEQEASSGALVAGSDALRRELELQEQQLLKRLAREAYDRTQP